MHPEPIELFIRIADVTGVLANAVLGGLIARSKQFDPVGFLALAVMSGLGGGMIRDVLLQAGPPIALTDPAYLAAAMAGATVAFFIRVNRRLWDVAFPYLDALALGCWSAAGASKALGVGLGWLPAILMGVITAVGGGALRDVVLRRTPEVFGGNTLYATSATLASAVLVVLSPLPIGPAGTLAAIATGTLLTLLARKLEWRLPNSYSWSPRQALAVLPRPRWRRWRRAKDADQRDDRRPPAMPADRPDTPPDAP